MYTLGIKTAGCRPKFGWTCSVALFEYGVFSLVMGNHTVCILSSSCKLFSHNRKKPLACVEGSLRCIVAFS